MAHLDIVFPDQISRNSTGGPSFSTIVTRARSGVEQRVQTRSMPLFRYSVNVFQWAQERRDEMIGFFMAAAGQANTFLFKDWADHFVGMSESGGALVHDAAHNFATGDGATTAFQLHKKYSYSGEEYLRKITRPKSAVKVYLGGVEQGSGWSADYDTGIITFSSAPGNGVDIGWSGEFYVPARLDVDILDLNNLTLDQANASLEIIEVRE